jgi:arginase
VLEARALPHREIATAFELQRMLADHVRDAVQGERFPLVLAGNCNSAVGTLAGIKAADPRPLGVVWLDGHADLNTPETTPSGFLDGMALAIALGRCWRTMSAGVPGFRPLDEEDVVLVGARDLDPGEREYLARSAITVVDGRADAADRAAALARALDRLAERVEDVYLHIDLDVLDPEEARANPLAPPGGLSVNEAASAVAAVADRLSIRAAAITAYDPSCDRRALDAAVLLARTAVTEAARGAARAGARRSTP